MRYVEDHRRQTHDRIVENASYGLRQKGAEGLSVVDLMKLAGLTHGGFYNHFESRAALVSEAIAFAMDQTTGRWKKLANGKADGERFEALVADYLSPRHRDNLNTVARFQPWLPMSLDRARASSRPWLPNWRR
jgi:TetR/AcrR family transcriptional repressor of nem operon